MLDGPVAANETFFPGLIFPADPQRLQCIERASVIGGALTGRAYRMRAKGRTAKQSAPTFEGPVLGSINTTLAWGLLLTLALSTGAMAVWRNTLTAAVPTAALVACGVSAMLNTLVDDPRVLLLAVMLAWGCV